jgi:hypothetical protein
VSNIELHNVVNHRMGSMPKIKLPVVQKQRVVFPDKPICPWCRKQKVYEPHSMAILNAGAMRQVGKEQYEMATDTAAFLSLTWHGAHSGGQGQLPEVYTSVEVAAQVASGQFDLYFCSTGCLRGFLNYCVDVLEQQIARATSQQQRSLSCARQKGRTRKSTKA